MNKCTVYSVLRYLYFMILHVLYRTAYTTGCSVDQPVPSKNTDYSTSTSTVLGPVLSTTYRTEYGEVPVLVRYVQIRTTYLRQCSADSPSLSV